jgi:phosphate transport system protein
VLGQLKQVLDAYVARDMEAALTVWKSDEEIDAMCTSLFRELLTYMMEDPGIVSFGVHLVFCTKNIERMGDHATNFAEAVYYMVQGQTLWQYRPKADVTPQIAAAMSRPRRWASGQYSSASMIVITRLVTDGSAGSGEW